MPFEWSFLLDALQTERDQGITIDTTQIRFRTNAREVVLDRRAGPRGIPAQHDHRRLAGRRRGADHRRRRRRARPDPASRLSAASARHSPGRRRHQQDGSRRLQQAALSGDQRRDFRAPQRPRCRPDRGDPDFRARRRRRRRAVRRAIAWYAGPTVVEALDQLTPARQMDELALRLPIQAVYKFDDRRIVAGRVESGSLKAGDEIVIMPAGKIAKIKTVEGWPVTPVSGPQGAGRSVGITLDRELFLERGDVIAHSSGRGARHPAAQGADLLAARCAADGRLDHSRAPRHHGEPGDRGRDRERRRSGRALQRRHHIDQSQSCRRDRHFAGPAGCRRHLFGQSAHRPAGDRGQRPHRRRRAGAQRRCRRARRAGRHRAGGIWRCVPTSARRATATTAR